MDSEDEKVRLNTKIRVVDELMALGYKEDFSLLEIIITDHQRTKYRLDEFIPNIGFQMVFESKKDEAAQRQKSTGNLTVWCAEPLVYKKAIESYKKELAVLKEKIDPPKKPDPKRLAIETLLLSKLRKAKMVQDNTAVNNPIAQVLLVEADVFQKHIKIKYGFDVNKVIGATWTKATIRQLKEAHVRWQNELL
jgi:hypothetical protein